ncbi:hypothetical protein J437_LFUL016083 [Ladona fulva]|uniref:Uncharacterized protein n=1 Tax=Ladona fulva TaxID=123851 RepID=A0A8K0KLD6_LADFU|nr:hypothetical protein J437_LFUL016083 [Ladona fulva]
MTNDGNFEPSQFTSHLKTLLNQFEKRFQDFSCLEPLVSFFVKPFTIHHEATETATAIARIISSEVENLELEIVDLKKDIILQAHATDVDFWKLIKKNVSKNESQLNLKL